MAKKIKQTVSNRFIPQKTRTTDREIFSEGDWSNINQDLMLAGWDFMQRETIHSYLKNGIPLSIAVQQTSKQILQCPINSKLFFKSSSIYR